MKIIARVLLSACLLVASAGRAVELVAEHEAGEVLLFPHFTARSNSADDFMTLVTLSGRAATDGDATDVAASADPVAVRVVFRVPAVEGHQPPPLMINLLLRSEDSWTFVASRGALFTADASCAIGPAGAITATMLRDGVPLPGAEGWIEVFELGRVISADVIARLNRPDRGAACAEIAALVPTLAADQWLTAPDNRLRGAAHFVSVSVGTSFTARPVVLRDFRDVPLYASASQDAPTLAHARPARADVILAERSRRTSWFSARPVDAVSAVLMTTEWELDFEISPGLAAGTDVVVTLPTRPWYVGSGGSHPPFQHPTRGDGSFELNARVFDREGSRPDLAASKCTPPFSVPHLGPVIDAPLVKLKLGDRSTFLSPNARPLTYAVRDRSDCAIGGLVEQTLPAAGIHSGRVTLQFVDGPRAPLDAAGFGQLISDEGHVFHGMPVIGTAATAVVNFNARPGVMANYGLDQPIVRRAGY